MPMPASTADLTAPVLPSSMTTRSLAGSAPYARSASSITMRVPRSGLPQHERILHHILEPNLLRIRERMIARGNEHKLVFHHRLDMDVRLRHRSLDEPEMQLLRTDAGHNLGRVHNLKLDIQLRVLPRERAKQMRQRIFANRQAGGQLQSALQIKRIVGHHLFRLADEIETTLRIGQQLLPGLGQIQLLRRAVQQLRAEIFLKRLICIVTAGWVICSVWAAAEKLPRVATV